jgi:hypothetical protein
MSDPRQRTQRKPGIGDLYPLRDLATDFLTPSAEALAGADSAAIMTDPALAAAAHGATGASGYGILNGGTGASTYLPGIAGAYGLYDLYGNNREAIGTGKGYLQGAASGAGIGWTVGGPVGAAIGGGLGLLGNALGIGHKSRTKVEENLRGQLAEQGIVVPEAAGAPHGKAWELNPEFESTRDESKLTGKDIKDAAWFYANIPNFGAYDDATREKIASQALADKAVREHHGTIEVAPTANLTNLIKGLGTTPTASSAQSVAQSKKDRQRQRASATLSAMYPSMVQAPIYDIKGIDLRNKYA